MGFPPFLPDLNPDHEAARMAEARKDPAAVSVAKCTYHECNEVTGQVTGCAGGGGEARGPISSALLIHKAEAHAAAAGHVVTITVRPEAEPGA